MLLAVLKRRRVSVASGLVVVAAVVSLVAYALAANGYTVHHAKLNDGGIWVTRGDHGQWGRLNKPIKQLDGYVFTPQVQPAQLDVLQDGAAVLGVDHSKGEIYPIDGTALATQDKGAVLLPTDGVVGMGGGVLAMLNPAKGAITAQRYDPDSELVSIDGLSAKPIARVGGGAAMTVGPDGTIYAASTSGALTTIRPAAAGFRTSTQQLHGIAGSLQITAAGDTPVVLGTEPGTQRSTAYLPDGHTVGVPVSDHAVVQQAGPASADVLVADDTSLWSVPLAGGTATRLSNAGSGAPAAPVQLRGCRFAAWAGSSATFAGSCSGSQFQVSPLGGAAVALKFRQNHQQVLLNEVDNGNAWDLDTNVPVQVANWQNVTRRPKPSKSKPNQHNRLTGNDHPKPPELHPYAFGARPGVQTSLYVLDFASDPSGDVMAVDSVTAKIPSQQSWFSISPDGQAVDITVPGGTTASTAFSYTVRTSRGTTATGTDTVAVRSEGENAGPVPRHNWQPSKDAPTPVAAAGTVTTPVLQNWRDYTDGDQVVLQSAAVDGGPKNGTVSVTPDGQLVYIAPPRPGAYQIDYTVGDGRGKTANGRLHLDVRGEDKPAVPATARPDYVRTEVGAAVTVYPLDNDLPGADPTKDTAVMRIATAVPSPAGVEVHTDFASGAVTIKPTTAKTLTLDYQVGYGTAPLATGTITVRVDDKSASKSPVTAPDVAVLHGQNPVNVDVLANDQAPSGNLLVVQRATPQYPDQLAVAVLNGRFLEIVPKVATLSPQSQQITYAVSDGVSGTVDGSVTVTQLPAPATDTPITIDDYATVRSGTSVAVPVLDNDSAPAGDPLSLISDVDGAPAPGRLPVSPSSGAAYVSGQFVRFVAPRVTHTTYTTITYTAQNSTGEFENTGHVDVTITPPPNAKLNPNQQPQPLPIDVRAVAGDRVTIKIPTSGVDPDGDPVSVTGIGSAPHLGRVAGFGASSISYLAFPNAKKGGTDTFTYTVADLYGGVASATIRVAIVEPGDPQPPIAVDDTVTVAPDATVRMDVLGNDYIATGDQVTIGNVAKDNPELTGVRLLKKAGPIQVKAGTDPRDAVHFLYTIKDGRNTSQAYVTVHDKAGANLPPLARDQYAQAKLGAKQVRVNLLAGDYDPDSTDAPTVVSPAAAASGTLTVTLRSYPQVIPYVISDGHHGQASAVVYVPSVGGGVPYARPGAAISLPVHGSKTIDVNSFVVDPAGKKVRITQPTTVSTAPGDLSADTAKSATRLTIRSTTDYAGPASLTFQVTDGASLSTPHAQRAYVTIPVNIGSAAPVMFCPDTVFPVVESAASEGLHIASICHVWTANPAQAAKLTFSGTIHLPHVSVGGQHTSTLSVVTTAGAKPGTRGTLVVKIDNQRYAVARTLTIAVVKAAPPTYTPVVISSVHAGSTKTFDITHNVHTTLNGPTIGIVGQPVLTTPSVKAHLTASGGKFTVSSDKDTHGNAVFSVVVSDEANDVKRLDRQVRGTITVQILGHPDAPTGVVQDGNHQLNGEVDLKWTAPAANGTPITGYTITAHPGGQTGKVVGAAPHGVVKGLKNGHPYTFTVYATNAVDNGPESAASPPITPNQPPGPVQGFTSRDLGGTTGPNSGQMQLTWQPDIGDWSGPDYYLVQWVAQGSGVGGSSGPLKGKSQHAFKATGLNNDAVYDFTIQAFNTIDGAPRGSTPVHLASGPTQTTGIPLTPAAPTASVNNDLASNQVQVTLTWPEIDRNGPGQTTYTVARDGTALSQCTAIAVATCTDSGIDLNGTKYKYTVKAMNGGPTPKTSPYGPATTVVAEAPPGSWSNPTFTPTGQDGTATLTYTAPASHGTKADVTCKVNGAPCQGFQSRAWTYNKASGPFTDTITGLTNGAASNLVLTMCNGIDCSSSNPVQAVSYGPIGAASVSASASGQNVNWSASVNANGKSAHIVITSSRHGTLVDTNASGSWSQNGSDQVGYSTSDTITITVSDPGRTTRSDSAGATTPNPPPTVTLSWAGKAPASICGGDTSCTYFTVTWSNFSNGNHTFTPYFNGSGNWCGSQSSCTNSRTVSGSSGSYGNYYASAYCNQNEYVTASIDSVMSSNTLNTNDHSC